MTPEQRFERELPALLAELASGAPPDYRDDIVRRTAAIAQRPAWTFHERWLPMALVSRRPLVAFNVPWRAIAMVALLAALLAVSIGIYIASRPQLPSPFGLAGNGALVYGTEGDIYVKESLDEPARVLIGGPEEDVAAQFSRRGDKLYILRVDGFRASLLVADPDGSNPRPVAQDVRGFEDGKVSPNGDLLAVGARGSDGMSEITIYRTDGSGSPRSLVPGLASAENPQWRPGTDDELLFRGLERGRGFGLYLVRADGSNLRRLDLTAEGLESGLNDFQAPAWSHDGTKLAFHNLDSVDAAPDGSGFRLRVADIAPDGTVTNARRLEFDRQSDEESHPIWTPSGDRIVYQRLDGSTGRLFIAPLDGPAEPLAIPPSVGTSGMYYEVSPDGRFLLATLQTQEEVWAFDFESGEATLIDIPGFESWQRVLP